MRDDAAARELARERPAAPRIALDDYDRPIRLLSGGQRQAIAIARAAHAGARILVLDEPTAALGIQQRQRVLDLVQTLANRGTAVVLISHDLETIYAVADSLVVLRLGRVVYNGPREAVSKGRLVHLIAGIESAGEREGVGDIPAMA